MGVSMNATSGVGGDVSFGITTDKKGNVGLIFTVSGTGGTPSAGFNVYDMFDKLYIKLMDW